MHQLYLLPTHRGLVAFRVSEDQVGMAWLGRGTTQSYLLAGHVGWQPAGAHGVPPCVPLISVGLQNGGHVVVRSSLQEQDLRPTRHTYAYYSLLT